MSQPEPKPAYLVEQHNRREWVEIGSGWDRERVIHMAASAATTDCPTRVKANNAKGTEVWQSDRDLTDEQE